MRNYKRVSRLFDFSVMLSVIAVLGVLFFCLNVLYDVRLCFVFASRGAETFILRSWCVVFSINDLFDVHLFVLFLPAEVRRLLFCAT